MAHRIEISSYEARELARHGIIAHSFDREDGYGEQFWVNETPAVVAILYPPAEENEAES